ncbi:hypothetical protein [Microcoleus sp. Pol17_C1]|uniref:hypothetical protein n=1 Tax=unclassified Microcoleus TaxID=2642155 RepID=UPI002FD76FEE
MGNSVTDLSLQRDERNQPAQPNLRVRLPKLEHGILATGKIDFREAITNHT